MANCVRKRFSFAPLLLLLLLPFLLLLSPRPARADSSARFDLVGPSIDVRVTRNGNSLPIAAVPNLQPGDRLWLHPDLPATQSVHYLLICVFLRGTTNPPPADWFIRIETWQHKVREEGVFVTVPPEAQQAVLFLAPETGGDFSTLRSAVEGRPGVFVRASQDLAEAGFEQARIEKYLASIRRVPPSDSAALQKHSELLARTLALKPNDACFKQPVDTQFTCLTQTGSQTLLDDSHAQSIVSALSSGPNSDFIYAASATPMAAGGLYSAYVGAIVDLVRIMGKLHTAQYQYIPAIAFPQDEALNLRLNTPPSFRNPKSVLVIGLPSIQSAVPPPLRPTDPGHVACLLRPTVVLPIEGAPLVFSTAFAHDLVLHFNTPPGAPAEPDIPLLADAYQGGLVLEQPLQHHIELHDTELHAGLPLPADGHNPFAHPELTHPTETSAATAKPSAPIPEPVQLTGTIEGQWGFDHFTGPTIPLQQLPGRGWHIITTPSTPTEDILTSGSLSAGSATLSGTSLIAGQSAHLLIDSTGSACVHTITAQPSTRSAVREDLTASTPSGIPATTLPITFKSVPKPDQPNLLDLSLPLEKAATPGSLHITIQQYGQPRADVLSTRTFAKPAHILSIELHAGDTSLLLNGSNLSQVDTLTLGDLVFSPAPSTATNATRSADTLRLALSASAPAPPTKAGENLTARIALRDQRTLTLPLTVLAARPVLTLLSKTIATPPNAIVQIAGSTDIPLARKLTFTLKTPAPFPRDGQIEIETLDGTLRTVLTLAPSGGLLLQDPHTIVATLDPLLSFGPSAFGPLQLRAVYPFQPPLSSRRERETARDTATPPQNTVAAPSENAAPSPSTSDWIPLGTLVRLPTLSGLQCPSDPTQPCTLSGSDLFLIDSMATDAAFTSSIPVPDGFTGTTLSIPQPATSSLFLHLRDDPGSICTVNLPSPAPASSATSSRRKPAKKSEKQKHPHPIEPASTAPSTLPAAGPTAQTPPTPALPSPTSSPVKPPASLTP